jgi:uncharacterized membrane protein YhaH (DUF805 family)
LIAKMKRVANLISETVAWRGRASRRTLFTSIGLFYAGGILASPLALAGEIADPIMAAAGIVLIAFLLGATVRRLHDRNRRSWWLIVFFGPHGALGAVLSLIPESEQRAILITLISGMAVVAPFLVWGMVELFFLRGTPGPNRFGPDPLAVDESGAQPADARA